MTGVLFRERTAAVDALVDERRRLGVDGFDEVWEGVYVVNAAPRVGHNRLARRIVALLTPLAAPVGLDVQQHLNLGDADDFRIPDVVVFPATTPPDTIYLPTAVLVVEVLSPNERIDERPFYLARGVAEVVLVDPAAGTVEWLARNTDGTAYEPVERSSVLAVGPADVVALLER